jgi:formylmethanofuran dehydrogenase subunit A
MSKLPPFAKACLFLANLGLMQTAHLAAAPQYDVVITNGRVVDGTGTSAYMADVAIEDGRIAAVGRIDTTAGRKVIDAEGLVVAAGFVDMMGQTATPMLRDPKSAIKASHSYEPVSSCEHFQAHHSRGDHAVGGAGKVAPE